MRSTRQVGGGFLFAGALSLIFQLLKALLDVRRLKCFVRGDVACDVAKRWLIFYVKSAREGILSRHSGSHIVAADTMCKNILMLDCIGVEELRGACIFSIREVLPAALGLPPW